jgi:hypothetical protein
MKLLTSCCLTALASSCSFAAFACENPAMVPVPDGKTSTMQQMVDAQAKVKSYMNAMEEYLACLNGELEAAGENAPAEFKSLMVTRHNTAVTEMESVASAFNSQVQAYKAANPQPPAAAN